MFKILMGERRGLNPRVVDSQSTALIHLATSAPTPAQVSVSIYDQILSEPPYDRYQRDSIVASLLLGWGRKASKQVEAFWKSFRGWAVHFIDLTSLYLRLKMGAGRTVKARLVDSKRAASYGFDEQQAQAPTPNKMKSSKLRLKKRAPIRESHCALCIGWAFLSLRTPKLQALKTYIYGIFEEAPFYKPFYTMGSSKSFLRMLERIFPLSISKVVKRRNLSSFMTKLI